MGVPGIEPGTSKLRTQYEIRIIQEWATKESNLRPSPYQRDALTTELVARIAADFVRGHFTLFRPLAKPREILYARTRSARLAEFPADGAILLHKIRLASRREPSNWLTPTELHARMRYEECNKKSRLAQPRLMFRRRRNSRAAAPHTSYSKRKIR